MLKHSNARWLDQNAAAIAADQLETPHCRPNLLGADLDDRAARHSPWPPWRRPGSELGPMLREAVNNHPGCGGIRLGAVACSRGAPHSAKALTPPPPATSLPCVAGSRRRSCASTEPIL